MLVALLLLGIVVSTEAAGFAWKDCVRMYFATLLFMHVMLSLIKGIQTLMNQFHLCVYETLQCFSYKTLPKPMTWRNLTIIYAVSLHITWRILGQT